MCVEPIFCSFVALVTGFYIYVIRCRAYQQCARQKWPYPKEAALEQTGKESIEECLRSMDGHINQVYNALLPGSMLLVVTGQGYTTKQRLKEVCFATYVT